MFTQNAELGVMHPEIVNTCDAANGFSSAEYVYILYEIFMLLNLKVSSGSAFFSAYLLHYS